MGDSEALLAHDHGYEELSVSHRLADNPDEQEASHTRASALDGQLMGGLPEARARMAEWPSGNARDW